MRARTFDGTPLTPGVNVDKINVAAGVQEAKVIGYDRKTTLMAVEYALMRWARGEEDGALKTFLSTGVDLGNAYRIIAAAKAGAE